MELGTFMMPLHPPSRIPSETLREDREAILLADRLGYCEAYVGEHVTDLAENVTSCLMFLSSLAFETKQIKLGSGTINMPNSHPAAVAAKPAATEAKPAAAAPAKPVVEKKSRSKSAAK